MTIILAATAYAAAAPLQGYVTAVAPPGTATQDGRPLAAGDTAAPTAKVETAAGRVALYFSAGTDTPASEISLYQDTASVLQLHLDQDARHQVEVVSGSAIAVVRDTVPLIVSKEGAWVRLESGMLRVTSAAGAGGFALAEGGRATLFEGAVPAGDPGAVTGGQPLAGQAGVRAEAMRSIAELNDARSRQASSEWIARAESADLVPAVTIGAPVREIPAAFRFTIPVIQETSKRCRWRSEKVQRALLLCVDDFGPIHHEDTPRSQLRVPTITVPPNTNLPPIIIINQGPVVQVQ